MIELLTHLLIDWIANFLNWLLTKLPTYWIPYLLNYLFIEFPTYLIVYLLNCLLTALPIYWISYLLNYLLEFPTYWIAYILNSLFTKLPTYRIAYLLNFLLAELPTYWIAYLLNFLLTELPMYWVSDNLVMMIWSVVSAVFFQRLRDTESDKLPVQVNAYLENMVDVQVLLEDSDLKATALMQVEELNLTLSHVRSNLILSNDFMSNQLLCHSINQHVCQSACLSISMAFN